MAKRIVDEEMKFDIIINGDSAKKELFDLEKATRKLTEENKAFGLQKKLLVKQGKDETEYYKAAVKTLDDTTKATRALTEQQKRMETANQEETEEYRKLTATIDANKKSIADLTAQKKHLEKDNKHQTEEFKLLTKTIKDNNKEIKDNKTKMAELQNQIGLTGLTLAQLQTKAVAAKLALRNMIPGSADFEECKKELDEITSRMKELNGKEKEADSSWSLGGMADGFNRYAGFIAGIIAGLTGMVLSVQKVLDWNGKLADSQTKVQKTTGMTKREVDALTESFGMLKTRSSRIELLGIAEIGGRLGIAKNEIKDFVKVMDKSSVALGDSFEGGPEVVAEKLGRIKGLYEELRDAGVEEAFESVGSALNDLGADGTASEQNLAEFAQRVGTLPGALKPTIQQALGLGAAFEESGLKAELAGNNYGKVITIAARDTSRFATVMKRPQKELEDLINTNPTEFFLQFSQSLKGLDATELAKVLDYLKLNDNEVKMVLGAASDNVDLFRDKIALAGDSMADATSLTTEYDLVNNNLAATLERLKKRVTGWFTSDSVVAFVTSAVDKFAKLIGAVEDSDGVMSTFKNTLVFTAKVLAILGTGFLTYTSAVKLATMWSNGMNASTAYSNLLFKIQYARMVIAQTATKALALVQALLSGSITRVKAAYQALSVAMGLNPFAALLAVIGAVIAAFVVFNDEADETNRVMNAMLEVQKDVADQTAKTKDKVNDYIKILKDENATVEQKEKALKALQKISNGYLDTLTKENIATAEGTRLIFRYIKAIDELANAKALVNVKAKLNEQKLEADNKILALSMEKKANTNKGVWFTRGEGDDGKWWGLGSRNKTEIQTEMDEEKITSNLLSLQQKSLNKQEEKKIDDLRKSIADRTAQLKKYKKDSQQYKELMQDIKTDNDALDIIIGLNDVKEVTTVEGAFVPDEDADKAAAKQKKEQQSEAARLRKEAERLHKQRLEDLKRQIEELRDLDRRGIDDKLGLMKEGFEKELALENENYKRKIEDLKLQVVPESDIDSAVKKSLSPKSSKQEADYWNRQAQVWMQRNEHLNTLIENQEQIHYTRLSTIVENEDNRQLKELDQKYTREKGARETDFNNQIADIRSLQQAKNLLATDLNNQELAKITTLEEAKKALKERFNKEELAQQAAHVQEMITKLEGMVASVNFKGVDLNILTPEQRDAMQKQIDELRLLMSQLNAAKDGKTDEPEAFVKHDLGLTQTDALGFTQEQWTMLFDNLRNGAVGVQEIGMAVEGLQGLWGAYGNFVSANENAQLAKYEKGTEARKKKLKLQLDNGYMNQAQYKKQLEQLDSDYEKKKADVEYKQARRAKQMALVDAIMNTAKGVTAASPNLILMALAGTMGALQIATIARQPLPAKGYEEGLYPDYVKRQQDGKVFKSTYGGQTRSGMVKKPTYFLAGENGPEMIIDAKAYRQMSPETKDMLIRELRGIKGFEGGYYNKDVTGPRIEVPQSAPAGASGVSQEYLLNVIAANTAIMEKLYKDGVVAYYNRDPRDLQKQMDDMDRLKKSKEKAKV